ncbi:hypothetical protein Tco_0035692 [Tanacetum coccineum]
MIGVGHAAYIDRFNELAKLVTHLDTLESKRIDSIILKAGALTDDAVRDEELSKSGDKKKGVSESSKQACIIVDNKKAKAPGQVQNNPNQVLAIGGNNSNCGNNGNPARGYMKPNNVSFSYVTEMTNGRNEEINKIIRGCTLVLEDIPFSIDLLHFELGSFDVVVGMD